MGSTIEILSLIFEQTCAAYPEQYDVWKGDEQVGYVRLRHGHLLGPPRRRWRASCDLSIGCSFGPGPGKLELSHNSNLGETE